MNRDHWSAHTAILMYDSRSGSTMVASLLNCCAGLHVSLETAFLSRILDAPPGCLDGNTARLMEHIAADVPTQESDVSLDTIEAGLQAAGRGRWELADAAMQAAYEAVAPGLPAGGCFVLKHAPYGHAVELARRYPHLRFIHVVRDGRAVYRSKKATMSTKGRRMERSVAKAARDWRTKLGIMKSVGAQSIDVSYEAVVADPESGLQPALDFLDLPESLQARTCEPSAYASSIGDRQRTLHRNVGAHVGRRRGAIQDDLTDYELRAYESIAGEALEAHGYPLFTSGSSWKSRAALTVALAEFATVKLANLYHRVVVRHEMPLQLSRAVRRLRGNGGDRGRSRAPGQTARPRQNPSTSTTS